MIKFFRKIRQKLLSENKFSKYLLYAIGEIVLVIIGILIALNINNKNEISKTEKKFIFNLTQVRNELKANIENTKQGIIKYESIDSLLGSVMSDTLEVADFKTSEGYYLGNILVRGFTSTISNNSFRKLNSSNVNLDESYNPLLFKLDSLYLIKENQLLEWDKRISSLRFENERDLTKTQTWFYDYLWKDNINDEGAKYFLTDPFYKNNIAEYYKLSRNHLTKIKEYRILAIETYNDINLLLNSKNETDSDSLDFLVNKDILKCYVGTYQFGDGDKTEITLKEDTLIQLIIQEEDTLNTVLHPISDTSFFVLDDGVNFEFDKAINCATNFLIWKQLGGAYKFTKINKR